MEDKKQIEFEERVKCGIAYCEDTTVDEIKQDFKKHEEKHKQIEKMKKLMCEEYGNLCNECVLGGTCANEFIAERLYNANYRKISEKEIPKKVTHEATIFADTTCPNCKNVVGGKEKWGESWVEIHEEYCKFCGQHLDWEDNND